MILFCSSNEKSAIPVGLKRLFLKSFEIKAPSEDERERILQWILTEHRIETDGVDLKEVANKTRGFFFDDLKALVHYADLNRTKNPGGGLTEQYFFEALGD